MNSVLNTKDNENIDSETELDPLEDVSGGRGQSYYIGSIKDYIFSDFLPIIKPSGKLSENYKYSFSHIEFPLHDENAYQNKNKHYHRPKFIIILSTLSIVILLSVIYFIKNFSTMPNGFPPNHYTNKFLNGIIISGVDIGGMTFQEAKDSLTEAELASRQKIDITIKFNDKDLYLNEDDFNFTYNTDQILDNAYFFGKSDNKIIQYIQLKRLKIFNKNYSITSQIDTSNLDNIVSNIKQELDKPVQEARVVNFNSLSENKFTYASGESGLVINASDLKAKLNSILKLERIVGIIEPDSLIIEPTLKIEDIISQTQLLASFSTVSTNNKNANNNMRLSLNALNNKKLNSGATLSFNESTGNTTNGSLGYLPADAILNGKIVQEYGGGICQTSTTLYGAAIRANMSIIERANHLWKSSYVPVGLDATINYPTTDLKIRNDSNYPMYIGAYMSGKTLTCEIYGFKENFYDTIEAKSWISSTIPAPEAIYISDNSLSPGTKIVQKQSSPGYYAEACRIFYKNGVEVKRENLPTSRYGATRGVILVGE